MHSAYKLSIFYFLLFSLLLLLSSAMFFDDKLGFSLVGISEYYLGNEEKFISAKSTLGILKIILPHIFAFGLFVMVLLHFLIFTKHRDSKQLLWIIYLSFLAAFLELISPFFIIHEFELFALGKLLAFFLFEGIILYVVYILLQALQGFHS